uniref:Uncharacterized protein n=1 Tax=Helianthus annuus TaxID=4232 RepID=A0A251TZ51_HELAN
MEPEHVIKPRINGKYPSQIVGVGGRIEMQAEEFGSLGHRKCVSERRSVKN